MADHAPAAERNREPIRAVLAEVLPPAGLVLEVASGTGQHAVYFAAAFPALTWQPSDPDPRALASIGERVGAAGLANLRAPVVLDVTAASWPVERADAVLCSNMIHIAPWQACLGLVRGAARALAPGQALVMYGPYRIDGATAPSNDAFDASLRARDPRWGVRELRDVEAAAAAEGLALERVVAMPANNHTVVYRRR